MLQTNLNVSVVLVNVAGSTTCQGYLDNYAPLVTGYEHPMTAGLTIDEVEVYPFREEWYQSGMQTFERLESF